MYSNESKTFKKILVIDDNREIGEFICETLYLRNDYHIDLVSEAQQISQHLEQGADIIFLDLCMPDKDGIEVIQLLAEKKIQTKLVLMSGSSSKLLKSAAKLAEKYGLDVLGILDKPFRVADLMDFMESIEEAECPPESRQAIQ